MQYKYIITLLLTMTAITVITQNRSPFLRATQSGWYPEFLNPVVEAVTSNPGHEKILDVGTGPGTLPQMLLIKDSGLKVTGIDIDTAMIDEAKRRFSHNNVSFQYQKINAPLEFTDEEFDVVTFCSVLFLVDDTVKKDLMNEALRILKPNGKIIILSPSGKKSILSSFIEVWKYPFSMNNFTFPIWKIFTSRGGKKWKQKKWLENYSISKQLNYSQSLVFHNNATLEIFLKK